MKTKLAVLAVMSACALVPAAATAQPTAGSGSFTLSGQVNTQFPEGGDPSANGVFTFGLGKFVSSRTQLFVGPTLTLSTSSADPFGGEGSSVQANLGASVGIKQLFGSGTKTFPYLGLDVTVLDFTPEGFGGDFEFFDGEFAEPDLLDYTYVGLSAGLKSFFKENVALDLKAAMGASPRNFSAGVRNLSLVASIEYIF